MLVQSIEAARCLIHLAAMEDEAEFLTHMRLQKLLYYVQGWSLGLRGAPFFHGRIEAWAHGPVVRDVYPAFADYDNWPIPAGEVPAPGGIEGDDLEFIRDVWDAYKPYSASALRQMTHEEAPWIDARGGCGPADRCTNEITHEAMRRYFSREANDS